MDDSYINGKRFLGGLIHRAEALLSKMIFKMEHSCIPLKEMIVMINSVHEFVNIWEDILETQNELYIDNKSHSSTDYDKCSLEQIKHSHHASAVVLDNGHQVSFIEEVYPKQPVFEFPAASFDNCKYKAGHIGLCSITLICDSSEEFYMIDLASNRVNVIDMLKNLQKISSTLHDIPASTVEAFGVLLDGTILRAARSKEDEQCFIKLIDMGDVLPFDHSTTLYELPPFYARIPAFALKCKLQNIDDEHFSGSRLGYLEESLGIVRSFEVVSIDQSQLIVSLSRKPHIQTQPQIDTLVEEIKYKISLDTLSQDQVADLFEEPLNTTNVMKAILGYDPQDDKRICPFFDPVIQGCFKGSHCRLEHVAKLTDGWTRDKALHKTKIRAELELPKVGSELILIPTYIVNVAEFYAHIPLPELSKALIDMQQKLNDPEFMRDYTRLNHEPHFHELVFARYSADGLWYRAEVIEFYHSNQILVFYVDYGNTDTVDMEQLRYWDDRFDYLPFQAVHCRVANISQMRPNHVEAIDQLRNAILDKGVRVRIIDNMSPWEVLLFDNDGNDIGEFLVITKLANSREPLVMNQIYQNIVPV
ncbi:uncharacterized protein LOC131425998 [Malaya genurostris]|uniref:uncharacterized protein LOC131425998 n=1 Tax=Malaya genurostris TaxID=325434 RepID=UPI0026F3D325|nr:uncharacterized protein LOC131425998 [Malaya genurostris]